MYSVLFVCTGNQFRSPIAAETFRQALARDGRAAQWEVLSAGTWTSTGRAVFREAAELAASFGVDISGHKTRSLERSLLEGVDAILVMENGHRESIQVEFPFTRSRIHLLSEVLEGVPYDIPDPAGAAGGEREIISELIEMVRKGAARIYQLVEK